MNYIKTVLCLSALLVTPVLAGATQQQPGQAPDAAAAIRLDLDDTDLYTVIRIIADALDINYIVDPAVKGRVNISTFGTLRQSDLLPILESVLKVNGATLVRTGNIYQIVPAERSIRQPLPLQESPNPAATDEQIALQIVRMRYVSASEMARLLTPYLGEGGNITIHEVGNILLVSDRRSNLRKLLDIVDVFDSTTFEGERLNVINLKNSFARDVVEDLKTVFNGYALSEKGSAIRFLVLERTNQILVISPNRAVFPEVEKWVERLDQPVQSGGLRTFIYKAKNSRAIDLQKVLSQLYGRGVTAAVADVQTQTPAGANGQMIPPPQPTAPPPPTPQTMNPRAGDPLAIENRVMIVADEINNALVIQATQPIYKEIELALRELDVLRRQVLIDAQIYEVSLDDNLFFGVSAVLQNRGTLERTTTGSFATAAGALRPSLSAQTFAYIGRARELLLFLNAEENRTRVRTLSAPSVLVTDNLPAKFQVGAEVPIPTSSSVTPVQSDGSNLFAQTIQFRNTGVILNVKPQINAGGGVALEIEQEVSQATQNTTSGIVAPVIAKSSVTSTVVVANGQTIALGGFIRDSKESGESRIPILGRIPVFGALFGNTSRTATRSELIVLITPHVLENREDAELATEELRTKLREIQKAFSN